MILPGLQPHRLRQHAATFGAAAGAGAAVVLTAYHLPATHPAALPVLVGIPLIAALLFCRAQAQAERSRALLERHRCLIESIDGIVWEADATTLQFSFVSRQAANLAPSHEWLQAGFLARRLHWDDQAAVLDELRACAHDRSPRQLEFRFFDQSGGVLWLHTSVTAPDGGNVLRGLLLDVTTRRRQEDLAQQVLVEKETILDNVIVGIVHLKEGHIASCNRRFAEMFGRTPEALIGESTTSLYASPEVFRSFTERAASALRSGRDYTEEVLLQRQDGQTFWGAVNGRAIDPAQPDEGSIWIFADVTERRQAEEEAHKLLRAVEQSPVSVIITDRVGNIEYVNPRFTRLTGFTVDEVIGRNPRIFKSNETPAAVHRDLWQTISSGREWHGVMRNRRKNGELFWEEVTVSPMRDERGCITHFLAVNEDIDERKAAEDALRQSHDAYVSLLATSLDGFWLTDLQGRLLDSNETYVRQSGYSLEELLAMRIHDLVGYSPALVDARIAAIAGKGSDQYESVHRRKDGSLWHVEVSASFRPAGGGQLFVFLRDITARKEIQRQLEAHHDQLETQVRERTADLARALDAAKVAEHAKDAFLANVSHELRTPLNAVIGLSGLAQKASDDPRQRATLQKINDAGHTLLEIINDLLDLAKISAGQMRFDNQPFNPRKLVVRVLDVLAHRAAEKSLRIESSVTAEVPAALLGDRLRVEQILLNLLSNALKFTAHGHVAVRLASEAADNGCVRLAIEVEDSGIGLTQEEIARLFKPFAQCDTSMTRKHGGTGLGLAICRQLANAMGGDIAVASRPGHGSTFRVVLRLGRSDRAELPAAPDRAGEPAADLRFPGARVLVVDDQPLNREVVFELLRNVEAQPQQAADGQEALDLLRAAGPEGFALVLMDIQMPVMDGLTATQEIRRWPGFADLPIVAVTAHAMEHEKASYLVAGMSDYLSKPFSMDRFQVLLRKWLPSHAVERTAGEPGAGGVAPTDAPSPLSSIDGLDPADALARFNGDLERYRRWLRVFAAESSGFAQQVDTLLAGARRDEARQVVHTFKGRVGMLGMTRLHALASDLESAIREAAAPEKTLQTLAAQVAAMCDALHSAIGPDKI